VLAIEIVAPVLDREAAAPSMAVVALAIEPVVVAAEALVDRKIDTCP